ncbi:TonB-dependent receptor [uncultured Desulfobacter sp.]|uniref:TonB-dependent receptor n=1 Tax=uncultured Desulfobacter sp. TaxID=240139 RepID=UPI002AA6E652|nr:TonB-dependent receptor [uncultured Desulfobacter sp.]
MNTTDARLNTLSLMAQSTNFDFTLPKIKGRYPDHTDQCRFHGRQPDRDTRNLSKDQDFKELLPRFSLGVDLTDDIYTYALVSKGFLAGGYNYSLAVDTATLTYDPEYVWNYEAGIKASFFQGRLATSLSAFYLKISDKQVHEQISGASPGTKSASPHPRTGTRQEICIQ